MSQLQHRQQKIQEKRKQTPWRQFVKEICSRVPLMMYKHAGILSRYPETERVGCVISPEKFVANRDEHLQYGVGYNQEKSFFTQYHDLVKRIPLAGMINEQTENAKYSLTSYQAKDLYLTFSVVFDVEQCAYSLHVKEHCAHVYNTVACYNSCEHIYDCSGVMKSQQIFYSKYVVDSFQLWFCSDMVGCQHCIRCHGLTNQSYCIDNVSYTKQQYLQERSDILQQKQRFDTWKSELRNTTANGSSTDVMGINILHSATVEQAFTTYQVTNGRNLVLVGGSQGDSDCYDSIVGGSPYTNHMYATFGCGPGEHLYCCDSMGFVSHIYYSYYLLNCHHCLGCIGLQNKSFCIFNKQYEKEEWFQKVNEIFAQMDEEGILGDFFPGWMNPFYFNDTAAYLIDDSFTKEEVEAEGYLWRDEEIKVDIPEGVEVVRVEELGEYEGWQTLRPQQKASDTSLNREGHSTVSPGQACLPVRQGGQEGVGKSRHIDPSILKKVIRDKKGNYYRIVKMEYDFLIKHSLPLPRLHRLDRLKQNFKIS